MVHIFFYYLHSNEDFFDFYPYIVDPYKVLTITG